MDEFKIYLGNIFRLLLDVLVIKWVICTQVCNLGKGMNNCANYCHDEHEK